jgi:hypothetical protein
MCSRSPRTWRPHLLTPSLISPDIGSHLCWCDGAPPLAQTAWRLTGRPGPHRWRIRSQWMWGTRLMERWHRGPVAQCCNGLVCWGESLDECEGYRVCGEVEHCRWVYGLTVNCHKKGGGVHMSMPANIKNSIEFSCSWHNVGQLEHLLLQPTLDSSLKASTECESTGASPPLGYHMQWWFRPCLWGRHNGGRIRARYIHIYTVTSDFSHKFIYGQEKRKTDM